MIKEVKPDLSLNTSKKEQVEEMFNSIAPKYDFLNRFLSLGIDKIWRKKAIAYLKPLQPKVMLDVATGTGDLALEAMKLNPEQIIGLDIAEQMLAFGRVKIDKKGFKINFFKSLLYQIVSFSFINRKIDYFKDAFKKELQIIYIYKIWF